MSSKLPSEAIGLLGAIALKTCEIRRFKARAAGVALGVSGAVLVAHVPDFGKAVVKGRHHKRCKDLSRRLPGHDHSRSKTR